ncbi:FAD-dependent oxidoreductase [Gracilibacillus dipsosauri]|uniref:FAD-dependent oxidoreductase n=1 Tax=Gracilibacillus dipsosauri TaxID=178340 RepID=UPI0024098E12
MKRLIVTLIIILYAILPFIGKFFYEETNALDNISTDNIATLDQIKEKYDVIVIGGEPEGVAAAVSASRNGQATLLVAQREALGGLMTFGMLNFLDVSHDKNGNFANLGIFEEWFNLVDRKIGFDIELAKKAFLKLIDDEENITLVFETNVTDVVMEGNQLVGVHLADKNGQEKQVFGESFIDATQDADIAVLAGAPYFIGGADIGLEDRKMAVTLMMHFSNVDWEQIKKAANDGVFGGAQISENVGWGFSDLHYDYEPYHDNTRLRGLNIVLQDDDSVIINALQIFGIDGLDDASKKEAIEIGKVETEHILTFLRENFPGFENAEIASYPDELYVRETRHVLAEYQLPMSDVWENKDHWDSIGFGAYPVDVQATSVNDYGYVISSPVQYAIPFRSLVPLEVDGLLVASKAAGYSSIAAGSARVLPTGMTLGEAAGVAASIAINEDISFREMTKNEDLIKSLQEKLIAQGANLYPFDIDYSYKGEWFFPKIKILLNLGLIVGGYENVLPVEKPITELSFANLLTNGVKRLTTEEASALENNIDAVREHVDQEAILTRDKAIELMLLLQGETSSLSFDTAVNKGLLDDEIISRLQENKELTGAEGYYLAGLLLEGLQ